jgi:hypothetical protein
MQRVPDVLQDRLCLGLHRVVQVATHAQTALFEKTRPAIIALGCFDMLAAIEFDDGPCFTAIEINDIGRDWVLSSELPLGETPIPEQQP